MRKRCERLFVHVRQQRLATPENGETFVGEGSCSRACLKDIIRHLVLDFAAQSFYYESIALSPVQRYKHQFQFFSFSIKLIFNDADPSPPRLNCRPFDHPNQG
ncbi:hypothetical protein C8R31_102494 [Nitrosospira sp. Nsp2]|nr:hypothetical protein C8R31_102494 [Nitrosospira sp. Nsp2]